MWHPQAAGLAQLHGEGKVAVFPAIGYDPPDESHFTSRHYWEVGELERPDPLGLDGALPRRRRRTRATRCRGCRSTTRWRPRSRPRACRWRRSPRPRTTTSGPTGSTNRSPRPTLEAFGALGSLGGALAGARAGARRRRRTRASSARRSRRSPNTKANRASPRRSPTRPPAASSRQRLAVLAAMLDDEALPIKCVSLNAVGCYDTHSDEVETLSTNLGRDGRIGARLPARPRSAQNRRPRGDPAVVGVRAPARRKTGRAPTTARPASRS